MSLDKIRHGLPIPWVMERYGREPDVVSGSRVSYLSPFREDHDPSLDVWVDDISGWRWGDFAEGTQGSVIDLIQRFEGITDGQAIQKAREFLKEFQEDDTWAGPTLSSARKLDVGAVKAEIDAASGDLSGVERMLRGMARAGTHPGLRDIPAASLAERWGLGTGSSGVLVPIKDVSGNLTGLKVRASGGDKRNAPGTKLQVYGVWRLDDRPVLLVEGETDTWAADWWLGDDYCVLGIPGASASPERLAGEILDGRSVTLCMDNDGPGRKGTARWASYLAGRGCLVSVILPPKGKDVCALYPSEIKSLPKSTRPLTTPPEGVEATTTGYVVPAEKHPRILSDWTVTVTRRATVETADGALAYETVIPQRGGKKAVLMSFDMSSKSRLVSWCAERGLHWFGSDADVQRLSALIMYESAFAPGARLTSRAGLVDGTIVWPGGSIGAGDDWIYRATDKGTTLEGLEDMIFISPDEATPQDVVTSLFWMLRMSPRHLTEPFLAWLAVAPLRPLFKQFPFLFISGVSGSGKTTLTDLMLRSFSGTMIQTALAGGTGHGITGPLASVNAFPVWYDEFRAGVGPSITQLQQLLLNSFTNSPYRKGGQGENVSRVTGLPTDSPIVVTGEGSIMDTALLERSIQLRASRDDRDPDAKDALTSLNLGGKFARSYLTWLLSQDHRFNWTEPVTVTPVGPPHLGDRVRGSLGILHMGWGLIQDFLTDTVSPEILDKLEIGELDVSECVSAASSAQADTAILEAVRWALDDPSNDSVFSDGDGVYVHPASFLTSLRNARDNFPLPTNSPPEIRRILVEMYRGETIRRRTLVTANPVRVVRLDHRVVDSEP